MFQFRRFPTYTYLIQCTLTEYCSAGFPHSEISGSTAICASPKLIAACHVLHRLLMPRHSPCALNSLTYSFVKRNVSAWFSELELCRLQRDHWNCLCYPKKFHNNFMFPSVACSSYFGYFVQFSRCVLVPKTRSKHSLFQQMLESIFRKNGGPKWTRTTDLTIISRAL